MASVDVNVIASIHDRAKILRRRPRQLCGRFASPCAPSACFAIVMDANQRSFGERGQSASLPAEKRFSSLILGINSEIRDASTVQPSRPHDRSTATAPPTRKQPLPGLQSPRAILLRCSNQSCRPMGHLSSFVVSKLTSVNRRATLFYAGDRVCKISEAWRRRSSAWFDK